MEDFQRCPCGSQESYENCCYRFHSGKEQAPTALALMKSRYSAFAKKQIDYIIKTTHPKHKDSAIALQQRRKQIALFCSTTQFEGLEIIAFEEKEPFSTVTFTAHLKQNQQDVSFTEKSVFEKIKGVWFYLSGEIYEN